MNVLLTVDDSRHTQAAVQFLEALRLGEEWKVYILHVVEPLQELAALRHVPDLEAGLRTIRPEMIARAQQLVSDFQAQLTDQTGKLTPLVIEGNPSTEILTAIHEHEIDCVVLGSQGTTSPRTFLLGGVSERVLNEAPCPVLVVRGQPRWTTAKKPRGMRIILAIDGSPDAKAAANFLNTLNLPPSSSVTVLHVVENQDYLTEHIERSDKPDLVQLAESLMNARHRHGTILLEETQAMLKHEKVTLQAITKGHVAEEIVKAAKRIDADLVVMGSRGLSDIERWVLGSVSHKVVRHAPCSMLVVRHLAPDTPIRF